MRKNLLIAVLAVVSIASISTLAVRALSDTVDTTVRITAQKLDDGRIEFALQQQDGEGDWGERILPRGRFFPANANPNRWLNSTPLTLEVAIPPAPQPEIAEPTIPANSEVGKSRTNPVPFGQSVRVGDAIVRVLGVIPDAQDIGYGIGEAGDHYYLANVEVTYLGERSKQHYYTLKYGLLGATNVLNKQEPSDGRSSTNLCYRPHEPVLSLSAELFGDGTIQGVLCYGITTADADLPEQVLVVVFGDTSVYPPEEPELFFLSLDPNRDDSSTARSGKSLSNPTPFGEAVQIGDWRIKVLAPPSDETDGSSSNVSTYLKGGLPEGWRMNGIEMSFTYVGATSSTLDQSKMELGVVAGAGTLYSSILTQLWYESEECGGGPLRLYGNTRLVENTTVRGYLCFKTTAEEVADGGLVLVVDEWGPNSERAFMALE